MNLKYHVIFRTDIIDREVYDLLTEIELESRSSDFWETWNSVAEDLNLEALAVACEKRQLPMTGVITPDRSCGILNFWYTVERKTQRK